MGDRNGGAFFLFFLLKLLKGSWTFIWEFFYFELCGGLDSDLVLSPEINLRVPWAVLMSN